MLGSETLGLTQGGEAAEPAVALGDGESGRGWIIPYHTHPRCNGAATSSLLAPLTQTTLHTCCWPTPLAASLTLTLTLTLTRTPGYFVIKLRGLPWNVSIDDIAAFLAPIPVPQVQRAPTPTLTLTPTLPRTLTRTLPRPRTLPVCRRVACT